MLSSWTEHVMMSAGHVDARPPCIDLTYSLPIEKIWPQVIHFEPLVRPELFTECQIISSACALTPQILRSVSLTPLKMIFAMSVQLDRAICPKVWLHTFQASWFESVETSCILPKLATCQRETDFIAPPCSKSDMKRLSLFFLLETGSQTLAQSSVFQV